MLQDKDMINVFEQYDRFLTDYAVAVLRLLESENSGLERKVIEFIKGEMFPVSVEQFVEYLEQAQDKAAARDKVMEAIWERHLVLLEMINFIGIAVDRQIVNLPLIKMMKRSDHPYRSYALATLCCLDFSEAVTALATNFLKLSSQLRWVTLVLLKKRWDDRFVPIFLKALEDQDSEVIRIAIKALSRSGTVVVAGKIKELLNHSSERVVIAAIGALIKLNDATILPELKMLFDKTHSDKIRSAIASAAGEVKAEGVLDFLKIALDAPEARVRANAIVSFKKKAQEAGTLSQSVLEKIKGLMNDPDHRVRADCIQTLWELGLSKNLTEIEDMLMSPQDLTRAAGAYLCGKLQLIDLASRLQNLTADSSWNVRKMASLALLGLGSSGIAILETLLDAGTADQQVIAAYALGLSDDPAGIDLLIAQSQSGNEMSQMATNLLMKLAKPVE